MLADHPLIYYRLDETSGSTAHDSSGNGIDGQYGSTVSYGVAGAIVGDPTDTAISISGNGGPPGVSASDASLPGGKAARTVEFWYKAGAGGCTDTPLLQYSSFSVAISGCDTQLSISTDAGTQLTVTVTQGNVGDNRWHLIDTSFDGTTGFVYFDGALEGSGLVTANTAIPGAGLVFGIGGHFGESFDEVAIYPTAVSPSDVNAHWSVGNSPGATKCAAKPAAPYSQSVLADSPLIYYRLDDISNSRVAYDGSGHCINGSYSNRASSVPGAIVGDSDTAISINGNGGAAGVSAGDASLPAGRAARTVEFWYESGVCDGAPLLQYSSFAVSIPGGRVAQLSVSTDAGTQLTVNTQTCVGDSRWHLIDISFDGATGFVYVDGALQGNGPISANTAIPGNGLTFGIGGHYGESFDEVAIYPGALSPAEVNAHWSVGASPGATKCATKPVTPYSQSVVADSPLVYYRLGDLSSSRVAYDASGHCVNGSYSNQASSVSGAIVGDTDTAISITGNGGPPGVSASDTSLPAGSAARTVEFWYKSGTCSYAPLIQYSSFLVSIPYVDSQLSISTDAGTQLTVDTHECIGDGIWHLIDASFDGTTGFVYFDGALKGSGPVSANTVIPGNGLAFGIGGHFGESFDEVAIYPTALSATQIADHFAIGANTGPLGGPLTSQQDPTNGNPSMPQSCWCQDHVGGFPINTASGAFYHTFTDFSLAGRGIPLNLSRTYSTVFAARNGPVGYGWTDSYDMSLSVDGGTGDVTISQENGAQVSFTPSGGGYTAAPRVAATLSVDTGTGDYLFKRDAQNLYTFNTSGQLIKETDLIGYATTLTYNGSGQLTTVTDPAGRHLTLSWTGNNITSVSDPLGRIVRYTYDGMGNLASASDPAGSLTTFTYDSSHRVLTMTEPRGGVVTNAYDSQGRTTSQSDPLHRSTGYAYSGDNFSAAGGTTTITDPKGNVTVESYKDGLLTSTTFGSGTASAATWSYVYDPATLGITQITDPNANITRKTYDASGNVLNQTAAGGRTTKYTYNSLNEPLTVTDPNAVTTTMTYDSRGNLLSRATPLSTTVKATTSYSYGDTVHPGDVTKMTDPNGRMTSYSYDVYGNRLTVIDPLGDKTATTYNADGWPLRLTDPKGKVTTDTYVTQGELSSVTDSLGHLTKYGYDADGDRTTIADPLGHTATTTYDLDNEPTMVTRADGTSQRTGYDGDGNVVSQTDALGHATTYTYDPLNHLTSMVDTLSHTTMYSHDGVGNLLATTLPDGQTTSQGYDANNELVSITYSDGKTPNVTMAYDADGQRVKMTDGTGTSSWTWDALHRMTSSKDGAGVTLIYRYDLDGNQSSIKYPVGVVTRTYDAADRLLSVKDWLGNVIKFTYDKDGDLTSQAFPTSTGLVDYFSYDVADQLTGITDTKGTSTVATFGYGRNADGLLTSESSTTVPPPATSSFGYNRINELTTDNSTSYAYDAADNLTHLVDGSSLNYNTANELTSLTKGSSTTTYKYDQLGNRLSATPTSASASNYAWDQANRLAVYTRGATSASYEYNGDGLRMSKRVGSSAHLLLWDESGTLPLLLSDGTRYYIDGPGGHPLEQVSSTNSTLWFHQDQLGSTRLLTGATGSILATYSFNAYGKLVASTGSAVTPFLFAGQYLDSESGLYYAHARYYDPATAQFLTRDPILALTRSPYAYVSGDPLNATDPTGLWFGIDDVIATVGGAVVGGVVSAVTQQVTTGHIDIGKVGIDAVAGAVGGETTLYAGPIAGGAAAGFVDSAAGQIYQHHGLQNFNVGELAFDTVAGAALGKLGDYLFSKVGITNPANWGTTGFRAAMALVRFGGGGLTIGGLSAAFGGPLAAGLSSIFGIGVFCTHVGLFRE